MKKRNILKVFIIIVCFFLIGGLYTYNQLRVIEKDVNDNKEEIIVANIAKMDPKNNEFIYLSDIDYIADQSVSGWKEIQKDQDSDGNKLSVKVEGSYYSFDKGIWAHAASRIVYDISSYNYNFFTAYIGLNKTAAASSNGVKFFIYTSNDGTNWTLKTPEDAKVFKAGDEAEFVRIDIKGAKYLKLEADSNGSNGNDHSVYVDAKLSNEEKDNNTIPVVEELDERLKKYSTVDFNNEEYKLLLFQRNLVKNAGRFALTRFVNESSNNKETFNWLFNNLENLELYTLGGAPDGGSYYNSLTVLNSLLEKYKSDFDIKETSKYGNVKGDLYKRMAISLSLTHSTTVYLWMNGAGVPDTRSNAVTRYQIYKDLYNDGKMRFTDTIDFAKWFEEYKIEEMRYVRNNIIDDEEILWLNEYTQSFIDANPKNPMWYLSPHPYMEYLWPNYARPEYYDEANKEAYDEKYKGIFSKYGVPYGKKGVARLWMNIEGGAVCGGISKQGSNNRAVHGVPSTVVSQPGHAAFAYYSRNDQGQASWTLNNWINGWEQSGKTERLSVRMPLGWGNDSYVSGWAASYILLGQEAINHFDKYDLSEKYIMAADVYGDSSNKKEQYLREALKALPYNVDAWWELIKLYKSDESKTEKDYYDLAEDLSEALMPFPLAMQNLLDQIKGKFTSAEYVFKYNMLLVSKLTEGKNLPNTATDRVFTPSYTRDIANFLLGQTNKALATFSFDGDDAGKIVFGNHLDNMDINWDYSLDGKKTWKKVYFNATDEHKYALSKEELSQITAEDDIYVHILGVNPEYNETNTFKIDITKATFPEKKLYGNDLENRVVGVDLTYEWRNSENDSWTSYSVSSPNNAGNKTLHVRIGAHGTALPSDEKTFVFTEDNQPDTRKYIPVYNLSIHEFSTQSADNKRPFYAPNAIDGNLYTLWHTDFSKNVLQDSTKPFITIKLNSSKYISALEFIQTKYKDNDPDYIKNVVVYASLDGENWKEAGRIENCEKNNELKAIEFNESVSAQYIKLELDTYDMFASLAMINLFEDTTKIETVTPTANIAYSTTTATNQDVIARLINPSAELKITNNGGNDTYVFTQNGEFTFEFEDKDGNKGTATATVTWIDREIPKATLTYDRKTLTNQEVTVTAQFNKKGNITNNGGRNTYTFNENGEFTFEFKDEVGNKGLAIAKVTWIDKIAPRATVKYDKTEKTTGPVVATLADESEPITILNNKGSKTYTFKENGTFEFMYRDEAGNIGKTTAKVDWIEKEIVGPVDPIEPDVPIIPVDPVMPKAEVSYSIKTLTNKDVVVRLINANKEIKILNNNGKDSYIFTQNGEFTFKFEDKEGNKGEVTARVNWIDKVAPKAAIKYSTTDKTTGSVVATLIDESEPITILNNNGKDSYTFKENGTFEFMYQDKAGNIGKTVAKVNWIENAIKPIDPIQPVDPIQPEDPSEPSDSIKPEKPSKPINPIKPVKPNRPSDPVKPVQPIQPEGSIKSETKNSEKFESSIKQNNNTNIVQDSTTNVDSNNESDVSTNPEDKEKDVIDTPVDSEENSINNDKNTKSNNPFQNYDPKKDNIYLWIAGGILLLIIIIVIDGNRRKY